MPPVVLLGTTATRRACWHRQLVADLYRHFLQRQRVYHRLAKNEVMELYTWLFTNGLDRVPPESELADIRLRTGGVLTEDDIRRWFKNHHARACYEMSTQGKLGLGASGSAGGPADPRAESASAPLAGAGAGVAAFPPNFPRLGTDELDRFVARWVQVPSPADLYAHGAGAGQLA